jgi:transposase-like protein/flagellar hook-basal body complex protein FliE
MKDQNSEPSLRPSALRHNESKSKADHLYLQDHLAEFQNQFESKTYSCPHCQSRQFVGVGKQKGVQRFKCKSCSKYFSETTGKFLYCLKKRERLTRYLNCFLAGLSIRESAKICDISIQTSFTWRHKLLAAFQKIASSEFEQIIAMEGTEESFSTKGQRRKKHDYSSESIAINKEVEPTSSVNEKKLKFEGSDAPKTVGVLHVIDWQGNLMMKVVGDSKIKKRDFDRILSGKLNKVEVICAKADRSITAFVRGSDVDYVRSRQGRVRKAECGYQITNVLKSVLNWRHFMIRFHGVATKYLQNYLNWYMLLNRLKYSKYQMFEAIHILMKENRAWYQFKTGIFNTDFRT